MTAVAKRPLKVGEVLDGEGGYMVFGKVTPARASLQAGALPLGLAHGVKLKNPVAEGTAVRWADVEIDETLDLRRMRNAADLRRG